MTLSAVTKKRVSDLCLVSERKRSEISPFQKGEPMPVTINTILILTSDGNLHIWVSAVSRRVLTRLGRVFNTLS
jgi:hypothetical protein